MPSKKMLRATQGTDIEHEGDLSSMIDMVFLLLIFFMVNANFVKLKLDPRVHVPVADESRQDSQYQGRIVLNILGDEATEEAGGARWANVDYEPLNSEAEVTEYIANTISELSPGVEGKLHVRADAGVEMRYVNQAIAAALNGNKVYSVVIATKPK